MAAPHAQVHDLAVSEMFSGPSHDHAYCTATALERAEQICAAQGLRLTPQRRAVLELLASTHAPMGAYDLIGRLADADGRRPAPISVYRALDFLTAHGLAHRIESRNAYVACAHAHGEHGVLLFMLCETCGTVGEAVSEGVAETLGAIAGQAGFAPRAPVIEIPGECRHCRTRRIEASGTAGVVSHPVHS